ncbi:Hypothetical predicted protein [Mytilus galloprovincialis]|uniref:Uncharacterized protein n=1 Tax=Mytilus galloprovincialis TaxID=29158 RepID=A0A8B6FLU2_MYTGA|nr:Hypothetical predicted protein [Mytilus galloprovincialis]
MEELTGDAVTVAFSTYNGQQLHTNLQTHSGFTTRSIFISWPKEGPCVPIDKSSINKAVQRIRSEGPSEKMTNAIRIRKATAVRCAAPETREVLAKHMSHYTDKADRCSDEVEHKPTDVTNELLSYPKPKESGTHNRRAFSKQDAATLIKLWNETVNSTFQDIFAFTTGLKSPPPLGLNPEPSIAFLHVQNLNHRLEKKDRFSTVANTCIKQIKKPCKPNIKRCRQFNADLDDIYRL